MVAGVGGIRCWVVDYPIAKSGMVAGVGGIRCWLAKHTISKSGDGCRYWG